MTVLYPFLPPQQIDEQALAVLRDTIAGIPRFDVALTHVDWFGDAVLWLAPQPDRPFRDLTGAVWQRFPEAPPYAGAHSDVVPHLTIGHDADKPVLSHAAETVAAHLPINAAIDRVRLIAGTPDVSPWRTVCEFPLGAHPCGGWYGARKRPRHDDRKGAVSRAVHRGVPACWPQQHPRP